jgi:hypothetical protein
MEEIQLTPAQRNIFPFVLALLGAAVALVGLFTPWLSIGANGLSGSKSDQGNFTYLIILTSLLLGLTAFVPQLRAHKIFIALVTGILSLEVLISYAIWTAQVLKAIKNFNEAADKLGNLGGLFGGALSNLANNLKPSITTGFYMVCAGAILGLVSSALIYKQNMKVESPTESVEGLALSSEPQVLEKRYFGVSQVQFIVVMAIAIAGIALVTISAYSSSISDSLNSGSGNSSSASSSIAASTSSDAFKCVKVNNVRNLIKLNQPSFYDDPEPTDIFVVTQFRIVNNCDKPIIGIKGSVTFQDVVGDTVFTGNYTDDETIAVGATLTTSASTGWTFNEFEDQHGQLAGMDQAKTHAIMSLTKVAFGDGTSING